MGGAGDVKAALKSAKVAIKDGDYDEAVQQCKNALKIDRKNYQALVMMGRAMQELGKLDASKKSLMLASQTDPDNPIAWQGLAMLCEKQPDISTPQEMIVIYTRMLDIVKDDEDKINRMHRKLAELHLENKDTSQAVATLRSLIDKLKDEGKTKNAWKSLSQVLSSIEEPTQHDKAMLLEAFPHILDESVLGENEGNYQRYLQLLYQCEMWQELVKACCTMAGIFPTAHPLEWMARVFVETTQRDDLEEIISVEAFQPYLDKLLRLNDGSPWGNLARGILLEKEGDLPLSKAHLRVGAMRLGKSILAWKMLLRSQQMQNDWAGVDGTCRRCTDLKLDTSLPENLEFMRKLRLCHAKALCMIGHERHLREALVILEKESLDDLEQGLLLMNALVSLGEFDKAYEHLKQLKEAHGEEHPDVILLDAVILRALGRTDEARSMLEDFVRTNPGSAQGYFELGSLYYDIGNAQKSLMCCLKAAKINPKLAGAFLYLGHHYSSSDNIDKARKCYEKAFNLNPCCDKTGAALSDTYRKLQDHQANMALLNRVTSEGQSQGGWAWLRLGLHYLAVQEHMKAVQTLQHAVHVNPHDSATYECLGDAYLSRGAHAAALKVFGKALEIKPEALYPQYQIAHIKQITGEYLEAIDDYRNVLAQDAPAAVEVIGLAGLAEVLICRARKYHEQFFFANVKDDCLQAMEALVRACSLRPNSPALWKLIGDACMLLSPIPSSMARFTIASKLVNPGMEDLDATVEVDKLQILQLGGRCYGLALQTSDGDAGLWHDLGVTLFMQGCCMQEGHKEPLEPVVALSNRAVLAIKKSLSLDPTFGKAWASLGIIASHQSVADAALAQHAFITSLQHQSIAETWTLLGALYLQHEDPHLAHEAFAQAQAHDPAFVNCWVGQALVAEAVGHSETLDLFRHTTLLGIQTESCFGYGHHITQAASDPPVMKEDVRMRSTVTQAMHKASDCLQFYIRQKEEDIIGLNMAGLTAEIMGLNTTAVKIYQTALERAYQGQQVDEKLLDGIRGNFGRILTSIGEVDEAMAMFKAIKQPDLFSQCGLALACLKAGKYEESYEGYTSALHWLAPDDSQKSDVFVALATLQYKLQHKEEAKSLLFQSYQLSGASVRGLLALASLGLITEDPTLTEAAMNELIPHAEAKHCLHHVAFLRATHALTKGDVKEASNILSRAIHKHPEVAPLWRVLGQLSLLRAGALRHSEKKMRDKLSSGALVAGAAGRVLTQAAANEDKQVVAQDAGMSVLACLHSGNKKKSLIEAQRAVLMCPGAPQAWSAFIAAWFATRPSNQVVQYIGKLAKVWEKKAPAQVACWLRTVSRVAAEHGA